MAAVVANPDAFRLYLITTLTIPEEQARAIMREGITQFVHLARMKVVRLVDNCRKTYGPPMPANAVARAA
jgi:hypothetical protein